MTSVAGEFDHMEIQQQYSSDGGVNNRWDADDWDNENSSARLFERSRIKALAGRRNRPVGGGMFDGASACRDSSERILASERPKFVVSAEII